MRITIVQGAFLPVPPIQGGAVEKVWHGLGREFAQRGHGVIHISRQTSALPTEGVEEGVCHVRVKGFDTPKSLLLLKFCDLIYSIRVARILPPADIMVTNTFWLPIIVRSRRHGRIYVHVARFPKGQMRLYRHVDRLQTVSTAVAEAIRKEVPDCAAKITVVPYPLHQDAFAAVPAEERHRTRTVAFVGRIHPEKGLELLLKAFRELAPGALAGWRLRIVGPWQVAQGGAGQEYLMFLKDLARPCREAIEFCEPTFDARALRQHYSQATLFVYPSLAERGETFGLAPLEAMATGCPPLVSDLACFRDFIKDGENGFVFDHHAQDPVGALAKRLHEIVSMPMLLAEVGVKAQAKARQFALTRVADHYLADFASLVT